MAPTNISLRAIIFMDRRHTFRVFDSRRDVEHVKIRATIFNVAFSRFA